jgi:hypothetical protein
MFLTKNGETGIKTERGPVKLKLLLLSFYAWFAAVVVSAQSASPFVTARSYSGQFTVQQRRIRSLWAPSPKAARVPIAGNLAYLVTAPPASPFDSSEELLLEPSTLAITCERLKGLFLLEMGLPDEWQGRINVVVDSTMPKNQAPLLTASHRPVGWEYELDLPNKMKPEPLVQAIVTTLLTELVNRHAGTHSAEVPFWLSEGLSSHLQAYNLPTFIVRPNVQSAGYQEMRISGLDGVRAGLRQHAPLSFQELCWPGESDFTGKDRAIYRSCAQLFVESLLHFKDGRSCLLQMLQEMPKHLNWQTAFLVAYHPHFDSLLDVEKWWSLNCVNFTDSDFAAPTTERECWHKLQETLDVPVEVHLESSRLPTEARLTLQEVITQWKSSEALPALQRTVRGLEDLQLFTFRCDLNLDGDVATQAALQNARRTETWQWHLAKELNPLVTRYLVTLLDYMKQSQYDAPFASGGKYGGSRVQALKDETIKRLDELDRQRETIRAQFLPTTGESKLSALTVPSRR